MQVQAANKANTQAQANTAVPGKAPDGFQDLLDVAMLGTGGTPVSKPGPKSERPNAAQSQEATDLTEEMAAVAAQAGVVVQPEAEQAPEVAVEGTEVLQLAEIQVSGAMPAVIQAAPQQGQALLEIPELPVVQAEEQPTGGDIVSVETTVVQQETATPVQAEYQAAAVDTSETSRLGSMLAEAAQELREIVEPDAQDGPIPQVAAPVVDEEIGETGERTEQTQAADSEPVEETQLEGQPTYTQAAQQQGRSQASAAPQEQRPLREIPESDRAVIKMAEPKTENKEKTPAVTEQPQAVQAVEARPEPDRTQPLQQAQPAQPQQTMRTDQMEQIRVELNENFAQGKMEFHMQLKPQELGTVDVRMVLEGGRLAVEIMAANPRAADMLARQAEGLAQTLRLQSFQVDSINVVTESQSADSHMHGAFNFSGGQAQQGGDSAQAGPGGKPSGQSAGEQDAADDEPAPKQEPPSLMNYAI